MSLVQDTVKLCGGITYWSLGAAFGHAQLQNGLQELGLEDLAPEVRGCQSALTDAVKSYYAAQQDLPLDANQCLLFRKLDLVKGEEDAALAVVKETREGDNLHYEQLAIVKVSSLSGYVRFEPSNPAIEEQLQQAYAAIRTTVSQYQVSKLLVQILEKLRGTSLRPSGALYWLAEDKLADWRQVTDLVQECTVEGESKVYLLSTVLNDEARRAVVDAVVNEVTATARLIEDQASSGGIKERAFKARRQDARSLHQRIEYFENLFGTALSKLHKVADDCEEQVVSAACAELGEAFGLVLPGAAT